MSATSVTRISARLDRLPITSLHRRAVIALAFAYFFELGGINTFGYAAPGIIHQWHVPVSVIALITSTTFGGMFVGAAFGGWFADLAGRKRGFIISILIFTLGSLANAASWDVASLAIFRFITGIGLSAMTVIANTYVPEVFPARVRGEYLGFVMTIGLIGIPATAWVARFLVPLAPWAWRTVFIWGALGLVALAYAMRIVDSPRWLHLHGREKEAEEAIGTLEQAARAEGLSLPEPAAEIDEPIGSHTSYMELFAPAQRGRTYMLIAVWVFQTLGFYGFMAWVPTLLVEHGFSMVRSLTFSSVIAVCTPVGALIGAFLLDKFDRKWLITGIALFTAVCGLLYGLTFQPAFIMIFGAFVVLGIQCFATALYVYTPELYPTGMRSSGHGLTYGIGRAANVAGPFIVAVLFTSYGYGSVFIYIAACWLITAVVVALFGPSTTGRSLESLNRT